MRARPFARPPSSASISMTGMPAAASAIAMPPPIVPAPITADCAIGRGRASPTGIWAAVFSAAFTWASACSRAAASCGFSSFAAFMVRGTSSGGLRLVGTLERLRLAVHEFLQAPRGLRRARHIRAHVLEKQTIVVREVVHAGQQVGDAPVRVGRVLRDFRRELFCLRERLASGSQVGNHMLTQTFLG